MNYTKCNRGDNDTCELESIKRADNLKLELLSASIEEADDELLDSFRDIEQIRKVMYSRSKGFC